MGLFGPSKKDRARGFVSGHNARLQAKTGFGSGRQQISQAERDKIAKRLAAEEAARRKRRKR